MIRGVALIVLIALTAAITACGAKQEEAQAGAAEPLIKFNGSTVTYSDKEILCH